MKKFNFSKSSSGGGVLWIVTVFLLLSATIRFAISPSAAIALDMVTGEAESEQNVIADIEAEIAPELVVLLENVKMREAQVETREMQIEARMNVLELIETEVAKDLAHLERAEADLRATISVANQAAEDDIARLTSVYENMKPEQASALFQQMEPSFAAGFLGRMRADAAALVMSGLEPELAYSISIVLAGRNADVPVEPDIE